MSIASSPSIPMRSVGTSSSKDGRQHRRERMLTIPGLTNINAMSRWEIRTPKEIPFMCHLYIGNAPDEQNPSFKYGNRHDWVNSSNRIFIEFGKSGQPSIQASVLLAVDGEGRLDHQGKVSGVLNSKNAPEALTMSMRFNAAPVSARFNHREHFFEGRIGYWNGESISDLLSGAPPVPESFRRELAEREAEGRAKEHERDTSQDTETAPIATSTEGAKTKVRPLETMHCLRWQSRGASFANIPHPRVTALLESEDAIDHWSPDTLSNLRALRDFRRLLESEEPVQFTLCWPYPKRAQKDWRSVRHQFMNESIQPFLNLVSDVKPVSNDPNLQSYRDEMREIDDKGPRQFYKPVRPQALIPRLVPSCERLEDVISRMSEERKDLTRRQKIEDIDPPVNDMPMDCIGEDCYDDSPSTVTPSPAMEDIDLIRDEINHIESHMSTLQRGDPRMILLKSMASLVRASREGRGEGQPTKSVDIGHMAYL